MAATLIALLLMEEGKKLKPYLCSEGYPTVGVGFRIGPKGAPLEHYTFELTDKACDAWLGALVDKLEAKCEYHPLIGRALANCNAARRAILLSMAYQMGVTGLGAFRNMLTACAENRWQDAANEMMDSRWALQTPNRAERHRQQLLAGKWLTAYGGDYVG